MAHPYNSYNTCIYKQVINSHMFLFGNTAVTNKEKQ